jgi:hypothetical protein
MGWVPLGFGEVYTPPYRVSQNYFRNVNVSNTTITNNVNITNVYNTTYVNTTNVTNVTVANNHYANMAAPGAVTAMPQSAFASGRPVAANAVSLAPAQVANIRPAQAAVFAPPVAPTRQALAPASGIAPAAQPPAQLMARAVVAKRMPAPAPPSFAAQQSFVQQHPGQPINNAAIRQAAPVRPPALATVRQAPVANAVATVHVGQRAGNQAALSKLPQPLAQPALPSRTATAALPGVSNERLNGPPKAAPEPPRPASAARPIKIPPPGTASTPAARPQSANPPPREAAARPATPAKSTPPPPKPAVKTATPAPAHTAAPAKLPPANEKKKEAKSTKAPE